MSRRKAALIVGVVVLAILAAGVALVWWVARIVTGPRSSTSSPDVTMSSAQPSSTASPPIDDGAAVRSRGQMAAVIPGSVQGSPVEMVACQYVIALASPDAVLDASPYATWRRTEPFVTPELYALNAATRQPSGGDAWWQQMRAASGWVEPVIDNVVGADSQAPGSRPSTRPRQVTVVYHRKLHHGSTVTVDTAVRTTSVVVTSGPKPLVSQSVMR